MLKKILHISNFYLPHIGGIEQVAYDIVSGIKNNYEQKIICFNDKKETVYDQYQDIDVIRVGVIKKIASQPVSFSYRKELKKLINEYKPDIIHIHLPNPLITIYLLSLKLNNFKLVIHWHSDIIKQKILKYFYRIFQNQILKKSNKIIATSENYKKNSIDLSDFLDKTIVLPNVVDFNKFNLTESNKKNIKVLKDKYKGKEILFFLGRHIPYKGLEYLIKASKNINKNAIILIAGSGPLTEKLKEQAKQINNIKFLGRISNDEVVEHLNASSVFLFPSITKNEAFGIALAEALYCGTPAVSFDIEGSGVSWVNQNGKTGFVVDNRNINKYAEAVNKLINNNKLREEMSINSKKWAKEQFNKDILVNGIKKLYSELLD